MIEFPKIGEGVDHELAENMVFSMHPHAIAANGEDCLYMQDTWLVTAEGGVPLATCRWRSCGETRGHCAGRRCWRRGRGCSQRGRGRPLRVGRRRPPRVPRLSRPRVGDAGHRRRRLFEKLCLEGFQSGLSWLTILRKREAFRRAFADFDPEIVARFGDARGRAPARRRVDHSSSRQDRVDDEQCASRCWSSSRPRGFARCVSSGGSSPRPRSGRPSHVRRDQRARDDRSFSRACQGSKRRGWAFVGPTTVYAFMQAMGLVNDHLEGCDARARSRRRVRAGASLE